MQASWLTKQGSSSCIVFLAGWGMDPSPFRSIPAGKSDVILVYDYRRIDPDNVLSKVGNYRSVHLLAWSMGVWVAGKCFTETKFASATAINGTLKPIDDRYGIPFSAYDEMILNLSAETLQTFYRQMFNNADQAERFLTERPVRSRDSIVAELAALKEHYLRLGPGADIFTTRIVGTRDRIFSAREQLRSWENKPCERIKDGHFTFYNSLSLDTFITQPEQCD